MNLTKKQIQEFKQIWIKESKKEISNEKAEELLIALINLLIPIYKPELLIKE